MLIDQRLRVGKAKATGSGMTENVIDILADNGFYWWGGYWDKSVIAWKRFQVSSILVELYLAMKPEAARSLFNTVTNILIKINSL